MDISQMHTWFRTYAQQMGMQNTRAILPEQIDILINTSINDITNQIVIENIGLTNDRVITDNSKIGQINSLRTLYKVEEVEVLYENTRVPGTYDYDVDWNHAAEAGGGDIIYTITVSDGTIELLNATHNITQNVTTYNENIVNAVISNIVPGFNNFKCNIKFYYDGLKDLQLHIVSNSLGNPHYDAVMPNAFKYPFAFTSESIYTGLLKGSDVINNYLFLVDFSLSYSKVNGGVNPVSNFDTATKVEGEGAFVTNYFPVRLIDAIYLADTLNDFVLKPRLRSPILVIYNGNVFDLYVGKFKHKSGNNYTLENSLLPYKFRVAYIKKPAVVKLSEDINGVNVDCDLPENLHIDILKHAVDLYRIATSGALYANQQREQQEQQENLRNNYRNEGNQPQRQN